MEIQAQSQNLIIRASKFDLIFDMTWFSQDIKVIFSANICRTHQEIDLSGCSQAGSQMP